MDQRRRLEDRLEATRRLEAAVGGRADAMARIGEEEFAVLLTGLRSRGEADSVVDDITAAFSEPFVVKGHAVQLAIAVGVNVGPGRRRTDVDLLWRTAEDSSHQRSAALQKLVSDVRGDARNLDEVAQRMAEEAIARFGLAGCTIDVGDRSWRAPNVLPERPHDIELPLRTDGRVIGSLRWWGPVPGETDLSTIELLLGHVAAALDRAAAVDDADIRARTDALTRLLNREGLAHELRELDQPFAVGVLDLDHFKLVNDAHGHDVGDLVLAGLADLLQRGRTNDLIARWGGEEIVVVMPATTIDGAVARLQRLLEESRTFVRVAEVGPITFSAGVTTSDPSELFADAVRRADEAMYCAKRAGRARVEVA